jgi:hypothetical protein
MKKKFLGRIARRKDSAPAKPDEGHEIPPPTAIEPGVPYSAEDTEGKSYGSHMELELLAADEPPRTDLTNDVDARESEPAPALESLTAPVPDEPLDATETPREAAPFEEYGLDLEPLRETEADESPDEAETSGQDDEAFSVVAESATEATAAKPEIPQESEPEAVTDIVIENEESLPESVMEASAAEPEIPLESESEPADDIVQEAEEPLAASIPEASPDGSEPSREDEVASHGEVLAESPPEQTDEPPETSLVENGFLPLVRDARGNWRPGKGFSRSELREAGLGLAEAARLHIRVDKRRRNAHPMNVAALEKAKSGV